MNEFVWQNRNPKKFLLALCWSGGRKTLPSFPVMKPWCCAETLLCTIKPTPIHNKQKFQICLCSVAWRQYAQSAHVCVQNRGCGEVTWAGTARNTSDSLCGCELFHVHSCISYFSISIAVIKHCNLAKEKPLMWAIPEVRVWAGRAKPWQWEQSPEISRLEPQVQADRANWNVTKS